jgi:hypothetical protein
MSALDVEVGRLLHSKLTKIDLVSGGVTQTCLLASTTRWSTLIMFSLPMALLRFIKVILSPVFLLRDHDLSDEIDNAIPVISIGPFLGSWSRLRRGIECMRRPEGLSCRLVER